MSMALRNQQELNHAEVTAETRACRRLWASVVRTAADDLHSGVSHGRSWDRSRRYYTGPTTTAEGWFASEDDGIGTFLWCCDILDLNAQAVRRAISRKQTKSSHGQYASLLAAFNRTREKETDETPDQEM